MAVPVPCPPTSPAPCPAAFVSEEGSRLQDFAAALADGAQESLSTTFDLIVQAQAQATEVAHTLTNVVTQLI
jgi:hypothetical protein